MNDAEPLGPKSDILMRMGAALLIIQSAEYALRTILTFVIQKGEHLNLEDFQQEDSAHRKKTLGQFLTELRKRADLAPQFDEHLEEFLELRNTLVHRVGEVPGWDLYTEQGRETARSFVNRCIWSGSEVTKILTALAASWMEQQKIPIPIPRAKIFEEITKNYMPLVNQLFVRKSG